MKTKIYIISGLQFVGLSLGVTLIASVAPDFPDHEYWGRIIVGAIGTAILLGGLAARDWLRDLGRK